MNEISAIVTDGSPWLADCVSLARALADANQRLASY
jgi:hypothetical protein